jgi:hypothetical protein
MKRLLVLLLFAVLAAPLAGQDFERPADWKVRFDRSGQTEADLESFVEMPPGWHITTGPSGIFWDPGLTASGNFRIEMEVFLFDPGQRREAFGMFFGGSDLEGANQAYTYFLIRNGGESIIKERAGAETPTVQPWTPGEGILSYADRGDDASVKNVLAVECGSETVRFFVNGDEVGSVARSEIPTDGIVGVRVNHALNLHISRLEVTPAG